MLNLRWSASLWVVCASACALDADHVSESAEPAALSPRVAASGRSAADGAAVAAEAAAIAAEDAAAPEASSDLITVHVLGRRTLGGPVVAGIPVLFYNRHGKLIDRVTSDHRGIARGRGVRGGSVTVVEAAEHKLTTIFDVVPGDRLTVGDLFAADAAIAFGTLELPPGPEPAQDQYLVEGACTISGFSTTPAVTVLVEHGCDPAQPVIASAFVNGDNRTGLTGYIFDPEVTLVANATAAIHGDWQPPVQFDLSISNLPLQGAGFRLFRLAGLRQIYQFITGNVLDGGTTTRQFRQALGGDGTITQIDYQDTEFNSTLVVEYRQEAATSLNEDISQDTIAHPRDASLVNGPLGADGRTGAVGLDWTLTAGNRGDGQIAEFEAVDANFEFLTEWITVLPPDRESFRLPQLPADLEDVWAAQQLDGFFLRVVDTPAQSYRRFRRDAEPHQRDDWASSPTVPGKTLVGF
jgi:hypothetical protein